MLKSIIIDWCSEFKSLDEILSNEYAIIVKDSGNMKAIVEGESIHIISFLTSADYGKTIADVISEFPELTTTSA